MPRKLAHRYSETKICWGRGGFELITGKNGTLFSQGIYPTKLTALDLPEWYVYGRYYKQWGYLSAAGVKDLLYVPNKFTNHMFKDDCLYISYDRPIERNPDEDQLFNRYIGYDAYIHGGVIVEFLAAAERYSDFDITEIKKQIEDKRQWYKEFYPENYNMENSMDKPYFEDEANE